jgi:TolA-binding protein
MRDSSAEVASHERHVLHPLVVIALLMTAFCSVATAQIDPIRDRGVHTLYGDVKVEADQDSQKPLSLEIQLYIINGTLVGQQSVSANGRYRFMDLRNGEYDVVVMSENTEVARLRVRVDSVYKTDFRQDIVLGAKTENRPNKPGTVSVAEVYERTPANKALFEKAQKAIDEKKYDEALDRLTRLVDRIRHGTRHTQQRGGSGKSLPPRDSRMPDLRAGVTQFRTPAFGAEEVRCRHRTVD